MKKPIGKLLIALSAALCLLSVPVFAANDVAINETNFPDANFRSYVSKNIDTNSDGKLSANEITQVQAIYVSHLSIQSLKGIEYFKNLTGLNCNDNYLTALDVRKNPALKYLFCDSNQLTSLDVSRNPALTGLYCSNNYLTALDVRKNPALKDLACVVNYLTELDVSRDTALKCLNCCNNQLTSLDVSKNTALEKLYCDSNQLTVLDVSKNTALTSLYCESNQLTALDVSKNTALTELRCGSNQLTVLDVSKNTALTSLYCDGNQLTSLDVSKNAALTYQSCDGNTYTIEVGKDCTFDLSTLPGFDVSKASNWAGGTVNGTVLTVDADTETVTYDYDSGYRNDPAIIMSVTLNVTVKSDPDPDPDPNPEPEPDPNPNPDPDPEPEKPEFADVPSDAYYAPAVDWAVENGVVYGTSDTTFGPDEKCTRAHVVAFLWRAKGKPEPSSTENPFTDVKSSDYYYKAVLWAVENGVVYGTSDTTFEPESPCTRAQVAAFLYRAEKKPEPTTDSNPFTDVKSGEYYEKAVIWAVENGIVYGTSDTTFEPNATCTRAQGVAFLYRTYAK